MNAVRPEPARAHKPSPHGKVNGQAISKIDVAVLTLPSWQGSRFPQRHPAVNPEKSHEHRHHRKHEVRLLQVHRVPVLELPLLRMQERLRLQVRRRAGGAARLLPRQSNRTDNASPDAPLRLHRCIAHHDRRHSDALFPASACRATSPARQRFSRPPTCHRASRADPSTRTRRSYLCRHGFFSP